MRGILIWWAVSATLLLVSAAWVGNRMRGSAWGMFVDGRGRFSLTQMQLVLWTIVILSLVAGVFIGRLIDDAARAAGALNFAIPDELLVVMGISVGSAAVSTGIKTNKDANPRPTVASQELTDRAPTPVQAMLVEEGGTADQAIDVGKFQAFWITLILIAAYVAQAAAEISGATSADQVTALPGFDATFVTLLGISHAGYLAGKIPDRLGVPGTAISFQPKTRRVGETVTISAGGADLTEVTEVRFGHEVGAGFTHPSADTVAADVPNVALGHFPVTLIALKWRATASDTLQVIA